ncbi:spore cortex-lytic enzyme [Paenibacillus rhizosphaerae]|uniref:Spore cortex-lytic enzyme n=1 Tax=Paenibacillus rhizosphaerae TaxID=297318 RepID=A0A1R1F414_9BACL|nr:MULTISPECIES: cell wall hydrolase [Paenibacillus]OMF58775.1 spore cortex-lytic enzyme [Paenibacillus rhizosphaerae]OXL82521.1 spore cortex-lytic enzyme [Paenibacillus sp. SSG-1]GIO61443.1 spore cortex-lytic enzyme [Paenibacillus cineris]
MTTKKWAVTSILVVLLVIQSFAWKADHAEAAPVLKLGSEDPKVSDLQYRLQVLGLYGGTLDGKYGPGTEASVKEFQREYGAVADGTVGPATWRQLRKYTLSKNDMEIMAKIIYAEARGESYKGQVAVGAVIMNRIQSDEFPDTIQGVVFQKNAFTAVSDGQYGMKPNRTAYRAAIDAVRGWDPTHNSLYYYNPKTATNKWIWTRARTVNIGRHVFAI